MKNLIMRLLPKVWFRQMKLNLKIRMLNREIETLIKLRDESKRGHNKTSHIQKQVEKVHAEKMFLLFSPRGVAK